MKKNIWIFNHYATNMYYDNGGRHYWFAKYLKREGYNPVIFCANVFHGFQKEVDTHGKMYVEKNDNADYIPFVFIRTPQYKKNGFSRIKNMTSFYTALFKVAKEYCRSHDKPDLIFASSVHPLTLVAGIKLSKKLGIKCICEVRDLWPESFVAYGKLNEKSLFASILYKGENWIYKKAGALIFTMEGGKNYIKDKKWDKKSGGSIDLQKVYYINNGIDLPVVLENREKNPFENEKFEKIENEKIIYTGSIREVNHVGLLLDTAKFLKAQKLTFCIFGDGDEREKLEKRVAIEKIDNVVFFGRVDKKYIPDIVSRALLLIVCQQDKMAIGKYGTSQNKMFDYLAAGKAIISNLPNKYSIINRYNCGIERDLPTAEILAEQINEMVRDKKQMEKWGENAFVAAKEFSFENHTKKLIRIIENI
ncbi:hypothetical protein IMSAGC012_03475 [Lachnospiraceae bacterium]|nr:hypothetical protein IMSAGC012_03475 [Lachnospiraceae bacterium]